MAPGSFFRDPSDHFCQVADRRSFEFRGFCIDFGVAKGCQKEAGRLYPVDSLAY